MGLASTSLQDDSGVGDRPEDHAAHARSEPPPPSADAGMVLYREVQGFWRNQYLLVLAPTESLISGVILMAIGSQSGPRDQLVLLGVWLAFGLVLPVLLLTLRLRTEVTPTHLRAGFVGFPKWRIPLDQVELAEAVKIDPIRDLGGWGIRWKKRFGWVQNVWGEHAVVVTLVDGRRRTLGTREPEELSGAILAGAMGEPGRLIVPIRSAQGDASGEQDQSVLGTSNA